MFYYQNERSFAEQMEALSEEERACVDALKARWEKKDRKGGIKKFSDEMYLRFARNSPGKTKFNEKTAFNVMKNFDARYLTLKASNPDLEKQLLSQTLFPVPNLKSHPNEGNHDVFYMKPSRYHPKQTQTQTIIDNLAYCMSVMEEREKSETEGIAFLANMDDWTFANFSVSYCLNFMKMLQGRTPVRVRLFLIVNPPSWFGKIWNIMKGMLAPDFRKKVHMIKEEKLSEFLEAGFETYLPDDMVSGLGKTEDMVKDFVTYRKFVEDN